MKEVIEMKKKEYSKKNVKTKYEEKRRERNIYQKRKKKI
jgi:hypothetical protein